MEHKTLAVEVRQLYAEDKQASVASENHSFCRVDLQKVIMMPRLPGVKTAVFTRRLVVFHEMFAPLKSLSNTTSVVWHEAISEHRADDIASSFVTAMLYNYIIAFVHDMKPAGVIIVGLSDKFELNLRSIALLFILSPRAMTVM